RRGRRRPATLPLDGHDRTVEDLREDEEGRRFLAIWRLELINRVWDRFDEEGRRTGRPFSAVLRHRVAHPAQPAAEAAQHRGAAVGRPMTPEWFRKSLHRARRRFAGLLLDEVARSLGSPTPEELDEELIALGLKEHCLWAFRGRYGAPG